MTSASLDIIDFTQENSLSLPSLPVISSFDTGWDKLQLALYRQPPYCIPEHISPDHIICINAGNPVTLQQTVDGQSETVDSLPCEIGLYPAHLWQSFQWHQEASFLQLYLKPTLLNQLGMELYEKDCIELVPKLTSCFDPLIYQIAIALKTALEIDRSCSKLYADSMANALAAHLASRYSTYKAVTRNNSGSLSDHKLNQVVTYIDEYLDQDLSLAELASVVQLSPYHFARLFKKTTGIAPHRYHIRCRINRAKQLLLARKLSLSEIAYAVGFASQGHLNYHFKRFVGVTPKTFLQQ
jgi:AraC family transcriptional regulator